MHRSSTVNFGVKMSVVKVTGQDFTKLFAEKLSSKSINCLQTSLIRITCHSTKTFLYYGVGKADSQGHRSGLYKNMVPQNK